MPSCLSAPYVGKPCRSANEVGVLCRVDGAYNIHVSAAHLLWSTTRDVNQRRRSSGRKHTLGASGCVREHNTEEIGVGDCGLGDVRRRMLSASI